MKILAIRLRNLTSIEGSAEIDFTCEPLRSAGIFAISGPTGAGKSTLLDAMCLALYDKAPRFTASVENVALPDVGEGQVNQSDVRNLLRRGAGEGYAEVDFLGVDGLRYRSRWSVRRARNKAVGSLRPQTIEVCNLDTGQACQGTKKELLEKLVGLLGLTYEQFTRTVLLAQNDFATFLKSRGAAKAELLEKLTGTGIYTQISQEVFARNKAVQEDLELARNRLKLVELLPEEEVALLKQQKQALAEKREAGIKQLAELNAQLNVLRSLQQQQALLEQKNQEGIGLVEKIKSLRESLSEQEESLAKFKEQWEARQPDLKRARQLDGSMQAQRESCARLQKSWLAVQQQAAVQEKKAESAEKRRMEAVAALNRLLGNDGIVVAGQAEAERICQAENEALNKLLLAHEARRKQLDAFNYPRLVEERAMLQKVLEQRQEAVQQLGKLEKNAAESARKSVEAEQCNAQLQSKKEALDVLRRLYENARVAVGKDVSQLRSQLNDGEACPVCGSKIHPYCANGETASNLFRDLEKEYAAASAAWQEANNRFVALQRDLAHLAKENGQIKERLAALQQAGQETRSEEQIREHQKEVSIQMKAYAELYAAWKQDDEEAKRRRKHCEELKNALVACRLAAQEASAAREQRELLSRNNAEAKQRHDEARQALEAITKERLQLLEGQEADAVERMAAEREKEMQGKRDKIKEEAEKVQNRYSVLEGEKKQLAEAVDALEQQQRRIESPERLPESIAGQQEQNLAVERQLSAIEVQLLQQEQNEEKARHIALEAEKKQEVADRWSKLNKLIGSADGSRFKVIAQGYTLNVLLAHANRHLAYLSRRYRLQQVPGSLALQVVDADMCDEIRTVYSLSGGESFLISLALALGLSSLSGNNLKVESLFIDEGFGSLDADSLRVAMEALEQLQMQGRKIGVISHVHEMSERIAVQIRVQKQVNGKSRVDVVSAAG